MKGYTNSRKEYLSQIQRAQDEVQEERNNDTKKTRQRLADQILLQVPKYGVDVELEYQQYVKNTLSYYAEHIEEKIALPGKQLYNVPMVDFVDKKWVNNLSL